ncbi:MAG: phosphatidylglycerophosphatase A [Betaproteobacteria bacterium]|jgi:phosphatidylglycerophosphatase A|nr:phosphatidylglycerophosphatase A [Betaproteobacteria bacterium]
MGRHPGLAFALAHPAHFVALGFGIGALPRAPGTFGTLVALPLWWLLDRMLDPLALAGALAGLFALGVWACTLTGRHLGVADHGAMVWDEIVAFMLVLSVAPKAWPWQLAAFVLFRAFDIAKPPPIRAFERRFKGGFGVMFDDLLAAGYTLFVLALVKRIAY